SKPALHAVVGVTEADQGKKADRRQQQRTDMSKGINHGTQPQKGTIPLPTERRSDQKLLHKVLFQLS
ncbi:hypothetical protein, partial [Flavitalea sp.]|nr:hypothetical protein [Flavitalea sp.]